MKANMYKWINMFLGVILSLLGYSCRDHMLMYGTPTAEFDLKGQVTNEAKQPLPNMQIVHTTGYKDGAGNMYWSEYPDTLFTDAEGKFYRLYHNTMREHMLIASDPARVYASDTVVATVTYTGGDGAWYDGHADLNVDFVLKEK